MPNSSTTIVHTSSPRATAALGRRLGRQFVRGAVIGLTGDLGGGKTTFVRGVLQGFGVGGVTSPSFVLVRPYAVQSGVLRQVVHVDLYRLTDWTSLNELGLDELWGRPDTLLLIEWFDRLKHPPTDAQRIHFRLTGPQSRTITLPADWLRRLRPRVARRSRRPLGRPAAPPHRRR